MGVAAMLLRAARGKACLYSATKRGRRARVNSAALKTGDKIASVMEAYPLRAT